MRRAGFTLLELLLVLAILGMAAAITVPSVSGTMETARFRQGAAEVRATLALARALAASSGKIREVRFDPQKGEYGIAGHGGVRRLPEGIRLLSVERWGAAAEGDGASLRFFPDGSADEAKVVVGDSGEGRIAVRVDPLTGIAEAGAS